MTDYTNVGGQRIREVFPYAPVSDVTLEELKEYSEYLLRADHGFLSLESYGMETEIWKSLASNHCIVCNCVQLFNLDDT